MLDEKKLTEADSLRPNLGITYSLYAGILSLYFILKQEKKRITYLIYLTTNR